MPASPRRPAGPAGRRRGRRGGRGRSRGSLPTTDKSKPVTEELPLSPEPVEEAVVHDAIAEPEADTSGDFREPHPEEVAEHAPPEDISPSHAEHAPETAAEMPPPPEPEPERERERERQPERSERPERPPERPAYIQQRRPEPKPWVKPADFRPAETSAISQAVAHATEIAESLKHTIDQLDEILELVEVAERQKLADEREIDELRRALRRIQPPRHQQPPPRSPRHDEPHRGHRDHGLRHDGPRHDEPRQPRQESHENIQRPEEPREPRPPETGEPPAHVD